MKIEIQLFMGWKALTIRVLIIIRSLVAIIQSKILDSWFHSIFTREFSYLKDTIWRRHFDLNCLIIIAWSYAVYVTNRMVCRYLFFLFLIAVTVYNLSYNKWNTARKYRFIEKVKLNQTLQIQVLKGFKSKLHHHKTSNEKIMNCRFWELFGPDAS